MAVGDIDDEPRGVDTWYITPERVRVSGTCGAERGDEVPANTPINTCDDIECDF